MALRGETIYTGAPDTCEDCEVVLRPRVCQSGAGFYIGTWCQCGPYSRESGYFATREEAEAILGAQVSEYARSTELQEDAVEDEGCAHCGTIDTGRFAQHRHADYCDDCLGCETDSERTLRLLEVLADALAAPGTAQLECDEEGATRR
jgi:hypothetical protein